MKAVDTICEFLYLSASKMVNRNNRQTSGVIFEMSEDINECLMWKLEISKESTDIISSKNNYDNSIYLPKYALRFVNIVVKYTILSLLLSLNS